MTINGLFNTSNGVGSETERNIVEDNIVEMIQLSGIDVMVIPRITHNIDEILNEMPLSTFDSNKKVEMYVNSIQDFGGDQQLLRNFGLDVINKYELVVSKRRYAQEIGGIPTAGDLIYLPISKILLQIDQVLSETDHYQLSKIYVYTLRCGLYQYSYEDFNTGITDVDTDLNPETFHDKFDKTAEIIEVAREALDDCEQNPFGDILPPQDSNG